MNVPRTKPLVRSDRPKTKNKSKQITLTNGRSVGALTNKDYLVLVARIVTYLPQLEERMIEVMAILMGNRQAPARQVFRSLNSEDARVKVMRALLEHSHINRDKGQEFDDVIDLFVHVKKMRNAYAHGLWRTHESGRVYLQEASADPAAEFLSEREVKISELETVMSEMQTLWKKCLSVTYPHVFGPNVPRPSPRKPPEPPAQDQT